MSTVTVELTAEDVELLREVVESVHVLVIDSEVGIGWGNYADDADQLAKLHRKLRRVQQEQVYPN